MTDQQARHTLGQAWTADTIAWQSVGGDGTRYALLEGQRDRTGAAFTYAFFIPGGFWDAAHWHTADARIVVVRGTLYLGYGDTLAVEQTQAYSTGSYVLVPANARHYDGSDEDTIIIGTAVGPWATCYVHAAARKSAGTSL